MIEGLYPNMSILNNINLLRWLFLQHDYSELLNLLQRLIWVYLLIYLPSKYFMRRDSSMYAYEWQCTTTVGDCYLTGHLNTYMLVMNSSSINLWLDAFVRKNYIGAYENLQHVLGENQRQGHLFFGSFRYSKAIEHISTFD